MKKTIDQYEKEIKAHEARLNAIRKKIEDLKKPKPIGFRYSK